MQNDPEFQHHAHRFFGDKPENSELYYIKKHNTNREWNKNANKFYAANSNVDSKSEFKLQERKDEPKEVKAIFPESSLYKRNEAKFFGEKEDSKVSSRGSVLQKNAAHFFGYDTPQHGDRIYEHPPPPPPEQQLRKPILAQNKVKFNIGTLDEPP